MERRGATSSSEPSMISAAPMTYATRSARFGSPLNVIESGLSSRIVPDACAQEMAAQMANTCWAVWARERDENDLGGVGGCVGAACPR
jgi:hypothetical protein